MTKTRAKPIKVVEVEPVALVEDTYATKLTRIVNQIDALIEHAPGSDHIYLIGAKSGLEAIITRAQ